MFTKKNVSVPGNPPHRQSPVYYFEKNFDVFSTRNYE